VLRHYQDWLARTHGLAFDDYDALWRWSISDVGAFWQSVWDFFDLRSPTPHRSALGENIMPGAKWFEGAQFNYAHQVFRHAVQAHQAGQPAIVSSDEQGRARALSWIELRRQVASLALYLRSQGVQPGDRVAARLPNTPETMAAFLATVSLGAIWSVCAPDMGTASVLDRFRQIEPKVLIACDAVHYGGRAIDRSSTVSELRAGLPSVQIILVMRSGLQSSSDMGEFTDFSHATKRDDLETAGFQPEWLPFDHPLWIVYSSGTTGIPKAIVHGHGGTVLVQLAALALHNDVGPSYAPGRVGERYHWYSSTGWIMWNAQVAGLLSGTTCCIYDGSPSGSKDAPDWSVLWRFAARTQVSFFGAGAAFYASCMKSGLDLVSCGDLTRIRALGSTGSPLTEEAQRWGTEQFRGIHAGQSEIYWCNMSGGTDFAGAFIGSSRGLPQHPGVMPCRLLGFAVESWDEAGNSLLGEVGELVCTQPAPSMPLFFWGDTGGTRYFASYFDAYAPGHGRNGGLGPVWRHGDWLQILPDGGCIIFGRSDATINRHGLRMGTSEIYRAVEALPEVLDSLVVDLEYLGEPSYMPLFVVLRPGHTLDERTRSRIRAAIREALSPRFFPDAIFEVPAVPRTLSGKKQELPVKKLLLGHPPEQVFNAGSMLNPECISWYLEFAAARKPQAQAGSRKQLRPAPTLEK
jgi:acetoacetyl-CoA synthetase